MPLLLIYRENEPVFIVKAGVGNVCCNLRKY